MPLLAEHYTVIAPDLLGHGHSEKPRGDYSLGAHASTVRDLMLALDHSSATVVGHSLGGGVAMQFAYQFPEYLERMVLVSSGGLGREVHALLRVATLPGAEFVLPALGATRLSSASAAVGSVLKRLGIHPGSDLAEMAKGYGSLQDGDARQAFLHTLRSVVDPSGQRASATDRLYLAAGIATLIVWGRRDPLIPVTHAEAAHSAIPGSRLEVFDDIGHFPQLEDPIGFAEVVIDFVESTQPAAIDRDGFGKRLRRGQSE
jgi:pimeloyl-ACP methyl ester carboxylesterase